MIRLIEVNRAAQHLAIEHDGVRFDWHGLAAMAIISLVEHMMSVPKPDFIDTIRAALHVGVPLGSNPPQVRDWTVPPTFHPDRGLTDG